MSILTMSNREIRQRVKHLNSTALWGRLGGRQFGSPEDLALAELERVNWVAFARVAKQMARAFREASITAAEAGRRMVEAFRPLAQEIRPNGTAD